MRLRIKTLMVVVAIAAMALGLVVHVRTLMRNEDDFALTVFMIEGMVGALCLASAVAVSVIVWSVCEDHPYVIRLRRNARRASMGRGKHQDMHLE